MDAHGNLVLLDDQDRSRWDADQIREGVALVERALGMRRLGRYQVEAAIAAVHAQSPRAAATDWPQIAALYAVLAGIAPSPVVSLNRAVAVSMSEGPAVALPLVEALTDQLSGWYVFHATRADLLRRLHREQEARSAYERASALASSGPQRRFLERRSAEMAMAIDHALPRGPGR